MRITQITVCPVWPVEITFLRHIIFGPQTKSSAPLAEKLNG